jgi:curli biogenesis system outer membrane secretion channel CsgG
MLKKVLLIIFLLILFMQKNSMAASEIDSKMQKIVKQFIKAYNEKETDFDIATVAVFPFQANEKLSKKKVNVAVSELITLHLVKSPKFKVIERNQLETILKEQELGLTGAIASETAAKVGQLIGARLLVLGNVIQVGTHYQISAKLVDTETSEIISAAISEVPIKVFDEEASRYLVIVPEYQTIGLYAGAAYSPFIKIVDLDPETHFIYKIIPKNPAISDINFTCGLRYWPKPRLMIDIGAMLLSYSDSHPIDVTVNNVVINDNATLSMTGMGIKATLNRCIKIQDKLNGYLGVGYKTFALAIRDADAKDAAYIASSANKGYKIHVDDSKTEYASYILRTGIEWKTQARFGWSLFCNLSSAKDIKVKAEIIEMAAAGDSEEEMIIQKYTYPALHIETTLALYF